MGAPIEHVAEASYRLEQNRPCGHLHPTITPILLCTECAAFARAQQVAAKASPCYVCGERNRVFVTSLESIT